MKWLDSLQISASGLTAERLRMDVIAQNLANANTTRTSGGGPYRRKLIVFAPRGEESPFGRILSERVQAGRGVRVVKIVEDQSPFRRVYDPAHPDADPDGMVELPNVNPMLEMVDLIAATRAYEANLAALNAAKTIIGRTLEMGRG